MRKPDYLRHSEIMIKRILNDWYDVWLDNKFLSGVTPYLSLERITLVALGIRLWQNKSGRRGLVLRLLQESRKEIIVLQTKAETEKNGFGICVGGRIGKTCLE